MTTRAVTRLLASQDPLARYLAQCRVRNSLAESADVHVPPTADEARQVISYLQKSGVDAAVIGSVGVLHHLRGTPEAETFRPTVDLDVFVKAPFQRLQHLRPPPSWRVDRESPGVVSWISPTGGYVDFLAAGQTFPSGERVPSQVQVHPGSAASSDLPIASVRDLFKLKLNSMRAKGLHDT